MTKKTETCASPAPESPDAAVAEWLFEEPFAGKPFINFIPPGALSAIGRLIDDPALNWPLPYDYGELKAVLVQLPQDSHDACGRQVVYAARVYLAKLWAQRRGPKSKPNPIEELRNLKRAADDLLLAVKALSIEAQGMLENKQRLHVPHAPGIVHLRYTVDAFLHEHRLLRNLKEPQPSERRGRKVAVLERKFQDVLDRIYEDAFVGVRPHRGFPAFEKAVTEPLQKWGTRTSQRSHAKTGSVHHLARHSNAGSNKPNPAFDPGDIRVNASTFMKLCRTLSAIQEKTSSWNRRNSSVATPRRII